MNINEYKIRPLLNQFSSLLLKIFMQSEIDYQG